MRLTILVGKFDDLFLRCLLLELNLVTANGNHSALVGLSLVGNHFESDSRVARPTNEINNFIKPPADHILNWACFTLAYAHNEVGGPQAALLIRGPGGDQPGHFGVFIIYLQNGANALERQTHIDIEIFSSPRRKVIGVGVVLLRQRIGVDLEDILSVVLPQPLELALVPSLERFGYLLRGFFGEQ